MSEEQNKCRLGALLYISNAREFRLAGHPHKFVARQIELARRWGRWALGKE